MSMNLSLPGCPYWIKQTTSDFSWEWYDKPVLEGLAAYKKVYHDPYAPKPPEGKDARNPYLKQRHARLLAQHEEEFDQLRRWVLANPTVRWVIT